jgi:hypothetical protein
MGTYGTTVLDRCARYVLAAVLICALIPATAWGTVTLGQIDDFEDGTMQDWVEGGPSPNPPSTSPTVDPAAPVTTISA